MMIPTYFFDEKNYTRFYFGGGHFRRFPKLYFNEMPISSADIEVSIVFKNSDKPQPDRVHLTIEFQTKDGQIKIAPLSEEFISELTDFPVGGETTYTYLFKNVQIPQNVLFWDIKFSVSFAERLPWFRVERIDISNPQFFQRKRSITRFFEERLWHKGQVEVYHYYPFEDLTELLQKNQGKKAVIDFYSLEEPNTPIELHIQTDENTTRVYSFFNKRKKDDFPFTWHTAGEYIANPGSNVTHDSITVPSLINAQVKSDSSTLFVYVFFEEPETALHEMEYTEIINTPTTVPTVPPSNVDMQSVDEQYQSTQKSGMGFWGWLLLGGACYGGYKLLFGNEDKNKKKKNG